MHVNVHVLLAPVDGTDGKMHRIERIDNVVYRELALVMDSRTIRMLVELIEKLTERQVCGIRYRDVIVLVNVRAGQRFDVVAKDVLYISHGVGVLLGSVVIEISHQGRPVAIAVAIGLGRTELRAFAITERLAVTDDINFQFTGRTVEVDADGCVVVLIRVLGSTEGIRDEIVVRPNDQVIGAILYIGHINPLAAQARTVNVTAAR